jgi:hypothetical protein
MHETVTEPEAEVGLALQTMSSLYRSVAGPLWVVWTYLLQPLLVTFMHATHIGLRTSGVLFGEDATVAADAGTGETLETAAHAETQQNEYELELAEQQIAAISAARALVPFVLSAAMVPYEGYLGSGAVVPFVDATAAQTLVSYVRAIQQKLGAWAAYAAACACAAPAAGVRWLAFL